MHPQDKDRLEICLRSCLVADLKDILQTIGVPRTGRKAELINRIQQYLENLGDRIVNTDSLIQRGALERSYVLAIQSVNETIKRKSPLTAIEFSTRPSSQEPSSVFAASRSPSGAIPTQVKDQDFSTPKALGCCCRQAVDLQVSAMHQMKCRDCGISVHERCHIRKGHVKGASAREWICPKCRSVRFDPFTQVEKTIALYYIPDLRTQNTFRFNLSLTDAVANRNDTQIQLRCFGNGDSISTGISWPNYSTLIFNKTQFTVVQKMSTSFNANKAASEKPVVISRQCAVGQNTISLKVGAQEARSFTLLVECLKVRTLDEVIDVVKSNSAKITLESATEDVIKTFNTDDDDIVAMSTIISLSCPLSLCRLALPARGKECTHLQCFDLKTFLNFSRNATSRAWQCTVCHKFIEFKHLIIDPYFVKILKDLEDDQDTEEVEVMPDGTWKKKLNEDVEDRPAKKQRVNTPIELGSDEGSKPVEVSDLTEIISPQKNCVEIDLTLSSDEEDPSTPAPISAPQPSNTSIRQLNVPFELPKTTNPGQSVSSIRGPNIPTPPYSFNVAPQPAAQSTLLPGRRRLAQPSQQRIDDLFNGMTQFVPPPAAGPPVTDYSFSLDQFDY